MALSSKKLVGFGERVKGRLSRSRLARLGLTARQVALNVVVLVLFALPVPFVPHPIGYIPLLAYLLVLLFEWVYLRVVRKGFALDAEVSDTAFVRHGSLSTPVTVENSSRLPIFRMRLMLRIVNPYGEAESEADVWLMVDSRDKEQVDARVTLGHIGVYAIELDGAVLFDPLGLMHVRVKTGDRAEIVSNPQIVPVDSAEFSRMALSESSPPIRAVISDGADYAGVRDYELGDPLKSIHWKLSARTGDLQTRLFEVDVNTRSVVIADFHAPEYDPEQLMECRDAIVETALASLMLVKARGVEAHLRGRTGEGDIDIDEIPEDEEMNVFTKSLPLVSPNVDGQYAIDLIDESVAGRLGCNNLILCTSNLSDRLVESLVSACSLRVNVVLVLAIPREKRSEFNERNAGLLKRLDSAGIYAVAVSEASELEVPGDAE